MPFPKHRLVDKRHCPSQPSARNVQSNPTIAQNSPSDKKDSNFQDIFTYPSFVERDKQLFRFHRQSRRLKHLRTNIQINRLNGKLETLQISALWTCFFFLMEQSRNILIHASKKIYSKSEGRTCSYNAITGNAG